MVGMIQKWEDDYLNSLCEEKGITREDLEFKRHDIPELCEYQIKVIYNKEVIGEYAVEILEGYDAYFYVI